ncbi:MAG: DNA mismatch repair endonuclease MutL [Magnetococcales bacterium]|nr:DNA mismatch repair endonuclease MutL [Magnetococcales bacterium]
MSTLPPLQRPIRRLPEQLANQIAAGEVVERPASVAKELIENSLDAAAERIEVTIEQGGRRLLQIVDNGHGMDDDQALLALERHATSKIASLEDLFAIHTLGFRGEALPSIASVSHLELHSRSAAQSDGIRLVLHGGQLQQQQRLVMPVGSRIVVRNLFYNTPARLKFLSSDNTEAQHITELVQRLALAYPHCHFTLTNNGKMTLDIRPGNSEYLLAQRLSAVFGADFVDNCLEVNSEQEDVRVLGWLGLPTLHRSNARSMHLFVNQRWIRDKVIIAALRDAYRDLIATNRYPALALFIAVPAHTVDVNVHPSKQEVRFQQAQFVYGCVRRAVEGALATLGSRTYQALPSQPSAAQNDPDEADPVRAVLPAAVSQPVHWPARDAVRPASTVSSRKTTDFFPKVAESSSWPSAVVRHSSPSAPLLDPVPPPPTLFPSEQHDLPLGQAVAQVHGTYILAQTATGIVWVDQHAAHERIVYQQLKETMAARTLPRQRLLLPVVIELSASEAEQMSVHLEAMQRLGVLVEPFGPQAFAVREVPAVLAEGDIRGLVLDLFQDLQQFGRSSGIAAHLEPILARMACHSSVRAHRQLSLPEMNALLRQMEATDFAGQCSHGRPTYVSIPLTELAKPFGRRS